MNGGRVKRAKGKPKMDVDSADMGTMLHFSARLILGKESYDLDIDQIAEKIRLMPENNPAFSRPEWEITITADPWYDRKARGAVWLRIYEAHRNRLVLGR